MYVWIGIVYLHIHTPTYTGVPYYGTIAIVIAYRFFLPRTLTVSVGLRIKGPTGRQVPPEYDRNSLLLVPLVAAQVSLKHSRKNFLEN